MTTLQKNPDSLRSQRKAKRGTTLSRVQRRAERRLLQSKQGYENIMQWRKQYLVSDSKPCAPGSLKYH